MPAAQSPQVLAHTYVDRDRLRRPRTSCRCTLALRLALPCSAQAHQFRVQIPCRPGATRASRIASAMADKSVEEASGDTHLRGQLALSTGFQPRRPQSSLVRAQSQKSTDRPQAVDHRTPWSYRDHEPFRHAPRRQQHDEYTRGLARVRFPVRLIPSLQSALLSNRSADHTGSRMPIRNGDFRRTTRTRCRSFRFPLLARKAAFFRRPSFDIEFLTSTPPSSLALLA